MNEVWELDSAGRMSAKRSAKNVGHWSRYVARNKSVNVCENLLRKTRSNRQLKKGGYIAHAHSALDSADPYVYSDWMYAKNVCRRVSKDFSSKGSDLAMISKSECR